MHREKITIIDDFLTKPAFEKVAKFCEEVPLGRISNSNGEHWIADRHTLDAIDPTVSEYLTEMSITAARGAGFRHVQESPWSRSGVSLKEYREGDFHTRHRDTNTVSVVFIMNAAELGGETVLDDGHRIAAKPNRLVIFRGSEMYHRVDRVEYGIKAVFIVNLYDSQLPIERPEGTDELVYG